ncbi:DUF3043 family protein [Tamaricihabitans halophyticus]|uniref:DUF3043 family protein n=1 Tax=Tamaricihabitans halophyticus TaxID=1262583 RepID=A0A4R2QZG9_9PSEU|nr:DUF3043 domain-containing protein [Tamaricihabitans halophyticus]TCP55087.1 DUF3043 family protein [Tamaricihabitans halophyticus]
MKFLRRQSTEPEGSAAEANDVDAEVADAADDDKRHTPSKGRPTPKRREAEARRRGPVAPPPRTTREAMKRSKATRPSKEERRQASAERRERMMAGDDRYLLPRDRGPIKAYVRDVVDSRRNLLGMFMPLAILVFISLLVPYPQVQQFATLLCTLMLLGMLLEGFFNGRRITQQVRAKFPKEEIKGRSIGWYAFVRASQVRRLRVPKPRLKPGDQLR